MKTRVITAAVLLMMAVSTAMATGDKDKEKDKNRKVDSKEAFSVSGTVVDKETGEALAGVLVKVDETGTSVYSDFDGNFELTVIPGTYTISTNMISYETAKVELNAAGSKKTFTISLNNVSKKR
jgi:hypothetical protein